MERARARVPFGYTLAWAGIGVTAAAVVFGVWAFTLPPGAPPEGPHEDVRNGVFAVPVALITATVVAFAAGYRMSRPEEPPPRSLVLWSAGAAALAVLCSVPAFPADSFAPTADPTVFGESERTLALWAVLPLVSLGAVLFLAGSATWPERARRYRYGGLAAGALVVALCAALVGPAARYRPLEHTFLDAAPGTAPEVPTDITRAGWTWRSPESTAVRRVEAGTHGPLVVLDDGLVGLAGETGEVLWTYRRPYSPVLETGVLPDGPERAYVVHAPHPQEEPSAGETEWIRTVLDTATGRVVEEGPFEEREADGPAFSVARFPQHSPSHISEWNEVLTFYDPFGGGEWRLPVGSSDPDRACTADTGGLAVQEGVVLVGAQCTDRDPGAEPRWADLEYGEQRDEMERLGERAVVTGYDLATGELLWRDERPGDPDKAAPILVLGGPARPGTDPVVLTSDVALNVHTGEEVGIVPDHLLFADGGIPDRSAYLRLDTGGAVVMEDPGGSEPVLMHRTSAAGEVVGTTELSQRYEEVARGLPLGEAMVGTQGSDTVLVIDLDGAAGGEPRRIGIGAGPGVGRALVVPVPGAVVAYSRRDSDIGVGVGSVVVNGLVP
ncbi:hypothetical protein [Nocardiopsis changdeensis]|uniref:hypothetical protein n=1 Tax=Nocardiopsis changdeensis TaxID=2831969 RepID=UPI003F45360A